MGIEVGAFLINSALSVGANLVGSWLSPKKQPEKTIAEDIPQLSQGSPLYGLWGLSFCPGTLLYATPPALAGHGTDKSTYGMLGFANPDSTADILGLRINNNIVASRTSIFPLINPLGSKPRSTVTRAGVITEPNTSITITTLPGGLKVRSDLSIFYQMATFVSNPNFSLNGYPGLKYESLTWIGVKASPRQSYGGFNARFTIYGKNRVTTGGIRPFTIQSDTQVQITTTLGFGAGKDFFTNTYPSNFPRGFFGTKKVICFDNTNDRAIIGISGLSEYVIHSYKPNPPIPAIIGAYSGSDVSSVKFSLTGSVSPGAPVIAAGSFPVNVYSSYVPALTNSLLLGERNGRIFEVILPSPALPPFKSSNGVVRDVSNNVIYTTSSNFRCYGWAGRLFVSVAADAIIVNSLSSGNLQLPSAPLTGSSEVALTDLATIIQDLVSHKQPGKVIINQSTPVDIGGFTTDYDNVDNTIIDLCTAYGKLIFEDGEGDFWLTDYPSATPVEIFTSKDFIEKPSIEFSPEFNQPNQIQFAFRSTNDQLSEKIVHVGYSNKFGSTANVKYNLCIDEEEAKRLAWNILFLRSHTNQKLTFRSDKSIPRAGLVIQYNNQLYLVGAMEIGQDMTFRYTCVNYVPLNEGFTAYMLGGSSITVEAPPAIDSIDSFTLSAETRKITGDNARLGFFFTESNSVAGIRRNDGNLTNISSFTPVDGGFTGQVSQFSSLTSSPLAHGYETITLSRTTGNNYILPVSKILRIGQSWVKFDTFSQSGNTFELFGIRSGLFGSSPTINGGDFVIDAAAGNELSSYQLNALPLVSQSGFTYNMISSPEPIFPNTVVPFGSVTARHPHGFPVSGAAPAQLMASSYGGVLRVWTSKPGNQDDGFFLNNKVGGVDIAETQWYFQSGMSYLSTINIPVGTPYVQTTTALVPLGNFLTYQAKIGHTIASPKLNVIGSFTFSCSSF